MAVHALDAAGIPWTEVFVGGGVATIGAAISAGLAIGALVRRVAPAGSVDLGPRLGLPKLPDNDVILYLDTDSRNPGPEYRVYAHPESEDLGLYGVDAFDQDGTSVQCSPGGSASPSASRPTVPATYAIGRRTGTMISAPPASAAATAVRP